MISSRKYQVIISVIIACICMTSFGAEPNEVKTELKFEIRSATPQRWITSRGQSVTGPIKPTHVAEFFIKGEKSHIYISDSKGIKFMQKAWNFPNNEDIKMMLQTTAGRSISRKQHEFIATSNALLQTKIIIRDRPNYRLYAVSEIDARKMVEAFVEVLAEKANAKMQKFNETLHNAREKLVHMKEMLPKKEDQAKAAESKYKEIKDARYSLLADTEAKERAKDTMLEMYKMLDVLEIELAGIREKMSVLNEYRKTPQDIQAIERRRQLPEGMLVKLEQMFVEQTIELKSIEARKEASLRIRNREKAILNCFNRRTSLDEEVNRLKDDIKEYESGIRKSESILANPSRHMLPQEIYQNKVTIYPVQHNVDNAASGR